MNVTIQTSPDNSAFNQILTNDFTNELAYVRWKECMTAKNSLKSITVDASGDWITVKCNDLELLLCAEPVYDKAKKMNQSLCFPVAQVEGIEPANNEELKKMLLQLFV